MKDRRSVVGRTLRVENKNGITQISETCYCGWIDSGGKLWLTACQGRIRSLKSARHFRPAA